MRTASVLQQAGVIAQAVTNQREVFQKVRDSVSSLRQSCIDAALESQILERHHRQHAHRATWESVGWPSSMPRKPRLCAPRPSSCARISPRCTGSSAPWMDAAPMTPSGCRWRSEPPGPIGPPPANGPAWMRADVARMEGGSRRMCGDRPTQPGHLVQPEPTAGVRQPSRSAQSARRRRLQPERGTGVGHRGRAPGVHGPLVQLRGVGIEGLADGPEASQGEHRRGAQRLGEQHAAGQRLGG